MFIHNAQALQSVHICALHTKAPNKYIHIPRKSQYPSVFFTHCTYISSDCYKIGNDPGFGRGIAKIIYFSFLTPLNGVPFCLTSIKRPVSALRFTNCCVLGLNVWERERTAPFLWLSPDGGLVAILAPFLCRQHRRAFSTFFFIALIIPKAFI